MIKLPKKIRFYYLKKLKNCLIFKFSFFFVISFIYWKLNKFLKFSKDLLPFLLSLI